MNESGRWYRVSLRLMGDGLDVDAVTRALGLEPSHAGRKGQHIDDNPARGKYETNVWVLRSSDDASRPFEEQIQEILGVIEPREKQLREILGRANCEGELFLGYGSTNGQGGADISNETLSRIVSLGLSLDSTFTRLRQILNRQSGAVIHSSFSPFFA